MPNWQARWVSLWALPCALVAAKGGTVSSLRRLQFRGTEETTEAERKHGWNSGSSPRPAHAVGLPVQGQLWPRVPRGRVPAPISPTPAATWGSDLILDFHKDTRGGGWVGTRVSNLYCVDCGSHVGLGLLSAAPTGPEPGAFLRPAQEAGPLHRSAAGAPPHPGLLGTETFPLWSSHTQAPPPAPGGRRDYSQSWGLVTPPYPVRVCAQRHLNPRGVLATERVLVLTSFIGSQARVS